MQRGEGHVRCDEVFLQGSLSVSGSILYWKNYDPRVQSSR